MCHDVFKLPMLVLGNTTVKTEYEGGVSNPTYIRCFPYACHRQTCFMNIDTRHVIKYFAVKPVQFRVGSEPFADVNHEFSGLNQMMQPMQFIF